jgi:hypothetical protein
VLGCVVALCSGCDWTQWAGGPAHVAANVAEGGVSKSSAPLFAPSTVTVDAPTGQATTAGRLVFVQRDGTLTAYDAQTSGVVWVGALPSGSTVGSVPAVDTASRTVFIVVAGASNPVLVGFDIDGARNCAVFFDRCDPVFVADLGSAVAPASPPLVNAGKVFANGANSVYAFDATGQTNCVAEKAAARRCSPTWSASTGGAAEGTGPTLNASTNVLYDLVDDGGGRLYVGAFDGGTGASLWTGSLGNDSLTATPSVGGGRLFAPAGGAIDVFAAGGCGAATCSPSFSFAAGSGDPSATFSATVAIDSSNVFGTSGNGMLYEWPQAGCGAASCQPTQSVAVNVPTTPSTGYAQTPAVVSGMLFITAQQIVTAADHVVLLALDESNLGTVTSWDLGAGTPGAGLGGVSEASGVVYAPTDHGLSALHAPPVQPLAALTATPLTLKPTFSASTFDYTLACASGANSVTLTMAAEPGGTVQLVKPITTTPVAADTQTVSLNENQAAVVRAADARGAHADYWIRCLPHDFPTLTVTYPNPGGVTPGWYVLGNNPVPSGSASYAMILDTNGTPVWYRHATPDNALNVTPMGHDKIAFTQNLQAGAFDVYDLDHHTLSTITTGDSAFPTDFHELATTRNGDHLLLSYPETGGVDLTGLQGTPTPGANSNIMDCVVSEMDPHGNLVWRWTASDHIDPKTETTLSPINGFKLANGDTAYDVFHCNSIDSDADGNILVSARHMNALFYIRHSDGTVLRKLGGTPVNKDGATIITVQNDPDGNFVQQHDGRFLSNGDISMFDNQNAQTGFPARGVEYSVDFTTNTAQPVYSFATPTNIASCCTGDFRRYPDDHSIIDWGLLGSAGGPVFTEVDGSGNDVFDLSMPSGFSYRTAKAPSTMYDINILRATAGQ